MEFDLSSMACQSSGRTKLRFTVAVFFASDIATTVYSCSAPPMVALTMLPTSMGDFASTTSKYNATGAARPEGASGNGEPAPGGTQTAAPSLWPSNHRPPAGKAAWSLARMWSGGTGSVTRSRGRSHHRRPLPKGNWEQSPCKSATSFAYSRMPTSSFEPKCAWMDACLSPPSPLLGGLKARSRCNEETSSSRCFHGFAPLKCSTFTEAQGSAAPTSEKCASLAGENRTVPCAGSRWSNSSWKLYSRGIEDHVPQSEGCSVR
mmetsp:Transcript_36751/g.96758  ORF Transcript_36751/g.96758 Transcript_36751/m.96758 type:complete len:262 (-) Transcript_36751:199-984(-)